MNAFASDIVHQNRTGVQNGSTNFHHPLVVSVILFSIQATLSLMANFLVVFLFTYHRQLLRNPHNRCILSLAITDILTSISVLASPNYILGEKFYNPNAHDQLTREFYCRVLWSNWLPFALGVTSLYTSVVLSFERWLAVRRSIFYKNRFKVSHMNMLILASWITGLTAGLPTTAFVEAVYDKNTENCRYRVLAKEKISNICLLMAQCLFQIVIPLALITLTYIDVFRGIRTSLRFAASARVETVNSIKRLKKVTKVSARATFVLVVSWVPLAVWYFLLSILNNPYRNLNDPLLVILTLFVFTNCCTNPFIYVFSNPELRNAVLGIIR